MKTFILMMMLAVQAEEKVETKHTTSFVVFAADSNANPPMAFGGKLLSEMDRCAGITTRRFLYSSKTAKDAVTVGIDKVVFHKAAEVKDLLFVTGEVVGVGEKSIRMKVIIEREMPGKRELVMEGIFTFVAYDLATKKAVPHGLTLPGQ